MGKQEVYISLDCESTGPVPGLYSMLSLGAAAFSSTGKLLETYSANLLELPDAGRLPETMEWWKTQGEAWDICNSDQREPAEVMPEFASWVDGLGQVTPVGVGWPVAFDFGYINWYSWKFAGRNPLGFAGADIRSYAQGLLYRSSYYGFKEDLIRRFKIEMPNQKLRPHVAVDDAIEQGYLYCGLLRFAANPDSIIDMAESRP